ncbi:MAG TPA: hypothetical protein VGN51_22210 [Acidimicrobiia bacterium]
MSEGVASEPTAWAGVAAPGIRGGGAIDGDEGNGANGTISVIAAAAPPPTAQPTHPRVAQPSLRRQHSSWNVVPQCSHRVGAASTMSERQYTQRVSTLIAEDHPTSTL